MRRFDKRKSALGLAVLACGNAWGTTYYVSPTGSDANGGTSAAAAWQSVAKVNAAGFAPGDSILFQYGGTWNASLTASSSGTTGAPITYGAYGTASAGLPTFSGSDPIANANFTQVTGTTYSAPVSSAVNWAFDNHTFLTGAVVATGATDSGTGIGYVESNAKSFYYDAAASKIYVNTGTPITSGHSLTLSTRDDAVYTSGKSNLVFQNLRTTETAKLDAGYGFRVQNADNVTIQNSVADLAGKHSFGVIDSTAFTGSNLTANQNMPGLVYGGATGFVAFTDTQRTGTTSVWNNVTYNNSQGAYSAFYSHGDTNGIGSIKINGLTSLNGYGSGIGIESTGPTEQVVINGAKLVGGELNVATDHAILSGLNVSGNGNVNVSGTGSVVQNSVFTGITPDVFTGKAGAIVDRGTGTTVRFNTFSFYSLDGPAVGVANASSGAKVYANIFDVPQEIGLQSDTAAIFAANYNLYSYTGYPNYAATFSVGSLLNQSYYTPLSSWQALGFDANSMTAANGFADAGNGNYALIPGSPAWGLYTQSLDPTLAAANALLGAPNANGAYNAGAFLNSAVPEPTSVGLIAATALLARRRRRPAAT